MGCELWGDDEISITRLGYCVRDDGEVGVDLSQKRSGLQHSESHDPSFSSSISAGSLTDEALGLQPLVRHVGCRGTIDIDLCIQLLQHLVGQRLRDRGENVCDLRMLV